MITTLQFLFFCFRLLFLNLQSFIFFAKRTCNPAYTGRALLLRSFFPHWHACSALFPLLLWGTIPLLPCLQSGPRTLACPRGNEGILSCNVAGEDLFQVFEGRSGKLTSNIPFSYEILWFLDSKTYWRNEIWSTSLPTCPPIKWSGQGPWVISNFL